MITNLMCTPVNLNLYHFPAMSLNSSIAFFVWLPLLLPPPLLGLCCACFVCCWPGLIGGGSVLAFLLACLLAVYPTGLHRLSFSAGGQFHQIQDHTKWRHGLSHEQRLSFQQPDGRRQDSRWGSGCISGARYWSTGPERRKSSHTLHIP